MACDEICSVGERQGAAGIAAGQQGGGCDFELSIGTEIPVFTIAYEIVRSAVPRVFTTM